MSRATLWPEAGTRHPTAIIDPEARIHDSVAVGPYSIIGPGVDLERGVKVGPHVLIEKNTRVGEGCEIHNGAVLGTDPQDLKYEGEESYLEVGAGTTIREYATLNRGTAASGSTTVGSESLIMSYAHVAHDCHLGDHVILSNAVNMGGHVEIQDWAIVGGITAVHQFVRIGRHSFIGGGSRLPQDVVPYTMVAGNPCAAYGLNREGLRRRGFDEETLGHLRTAYRAIFQSEKNIGQSLDDLEARGDMGPEVEEMVRFIRDSDRGITT